MRKTKFKTRMFSLLMAALLVVGTVGYSVNAEDTGSGQTGIKGTEQTVEKDGTVKGDNTTEEKDTSVKEESTTEETTTEEKKTETSKKEETTGKTTTDTTAAADTTKKKGTTPGSLRVQPKVSATTAEATTATTGTTEQAPPTDPVTKLDIGGEAFEITLEKEEYTYTGSAITPEVVVKKKKTDTASEEILVKDKDYTVKYESNTDAGAKSGTSAKVIVEAKDTEKYTGQKTLTFTILQKDITAYDMKMEDKNKVYKGRPLKSDVNLYHDGKKLVRGTDYTVGSYANNTNVGTATGTVTGIGNYKGQRQTTFKISPKDINEVHYSRDINEISCQYNGNYRTTAVTLTFDILEDEDKVITGRYTLKEGVDYDIVYEDNKKVGMAGVMIVGKGNFGGSNIMTFKIRPQKTKLRKVEKGRKMLKATWTQKTEQVTGYVVACSTKKDFSSSVKKTTVKKNTTSYTFKKLKSKKTYYVRVRTYKNVAGIKYYSGWSNVMKVKTK